MPASQLKRLKASLRESGVTGPQRSKKQKAKDSKSGQNRERSISRASALNGIRENFNSFEVKTSSRGPKHEYASAGKQKSSILGRPGVTRGLGEELRRKNLLTEIQQRSKVGGIVDRRFGESDPTLTPEERAQERFLREKQRGGKKTGLFDLEADDDIADDDENGGLTHRGKPLSFPSQAAQDDYVDSDEDPSDDDTEDQAARRARKRRKLLEEVAAIDERGDADDSGRRKTKQEIMKEVMAKSKLHKYERQQAKEDDDDLRLELDADLKDIFALMNGRPLAAGREKKPTLDPGRAALIQGKTREEADREYDQQLRAMTQEARGKPTSRTKTEEELAEEEAEKLKDLEAKRLRRMRGEDESDESGDERTEIVTNEAELALRDEDEDEFGLGTGLTAKPYRPELDVEDEDDFDLDHDLIASGSEIDVSSSDEDSGTDLSDSEAAIDGEQDLTDDEAEFVKDLLTDQDAGRKDLHNDTSTNGNSEGNGSLAFTFPCPETHEEFLKITKGVTSMDLITIIQRVRALYSPKLDGKNRVKLATFAAILVDHLVYMMRQGSAVNFSVIEQMIRHVHSLAKTYPIEVANGCRKYLVEIGDERPLALTPSDLMLMTAIGEIFPTSDHFHQVVTPAMICMAWYLGQSNPRVLGDLATGAYICAQFLDYQRLSKRYIPEVVTYTLMAVEALSPVKPKTGFGETPKRELSPELRTITASATEIRSLDFWDVAYSGSSSTSEATLLKVSLLSNFTSIISRMSELWISKTAYIEIISPLDQALTHLLSNPCSKHLPPSLQKTIKSTAEKLSRLLAQARVDRKPLTLHNHRPLPIKTSIPKFEEKYNPEKKSHDPNRERVEASKLRAEYKKERKGALRELRKDANFVAREKLRGKKEADAEYEKKYRRLVAEIQGEEGREAKAYEREKRLRQGKR